jgi:hypothetical protein
VSVVPSAASVTGTEPKNKILCNRYEAEEKKKMSKETRLWWQEGREAEEEGRN